MLDQLRLQYYPKNEEDSYNNFLYHPTTKEYFYCSLQFLHRFLALQDEIALGCALLPESYALREICYTYDPLSDPNDIKISRARLRRWLAEGKIRTVPLLSDAPAEERCESETRARLREIIGEILSLPPEQIGDHAHFVHDLGGTSLDYFTLLARLDDTFGGSLQTETERFGYTVAELETMIEGRL